MGRDRTNEFFSVIQSLNQTQQSQKIIQKGKNKDVSHRSQFARAAASIAKDLNSTMTKLEKLTKLVKKKSIFDDRPVEIQELTHVINQDLAHLNAQISQLKVLSKQDPTQPKGKQIEDHANSVVISLQSKLANTSNSFKQILEIRTHNMKAQKDRREQFTSTVVPAAKIPSVGSSSALYRRDKGGEKEQHQDHVAIDFGSSDMQMQLTQRDTYSDARYEEIRSIESTIQQLGSIFEQLAFLVQMQGEQFARIDTNVQDLENNVSRGKDELLIALNSATSNKWLILKVFFVLIVFFIVFVVFFA